MDQDGQVYWSDVSERPEIGRCRITLGAEVLSQNPPDVIRKDDHKRGRS
jgi:hypothetical protein